MSLRAQLEARIAREGPLSVADYMEACNAHYYATRDPLGAAGDFITAPEISQIFGEMLGAWIASMWQQAGHPRFTWLEMGPGRGTLMRDALRATRAVPGFHDACSVHLLEISPVLRRAQEAALAGLHPRVEWRESLEALPARPLFFLANEFFDALPVRQFRGAAERCVELREGRLHFSFPAQGVREVCEAGAAIVRRLSAHIAQHGGAGLIVDYGYTEGEGESLQAMRAHAYADPLENPGEADLTTQVDFAALARAAQCPVTKPQPQGAFLMRLGAELRAAYLSRNATPAQAEALYEGLARLTMPDRMGELFKVLCLHHPTLLPDGFA